ncbi:ROK family protein [Enterococcus sp. LJL128]|uniref:ROK family protein n=1 Tax=Enterococcus sp. LJL51 TaxID=3416656 RepID=UPI003CF91C29
MTEKSNLIRQKNLEKLKVFLFENKKALKAEMSKETGISVVTINSLVKQLVADQIFIESKPIQQPLGRPANEYLFNYDLVHYLLVSIQEKREPHEKRSLVIIGKVVNLAGVEKYHTTIDFSTPSLEGLMAAFKDMLQFSVPVEKIGLSIPGKIDHSIIVSSWDDLFDGWNIEQELARFSDIPITIQNDAHLMTMGFCVEQGLLEQHTVVGIFYPEKSMPGITICANGVLLEGNRGLAGEAKYLPALIDSPVPATDEELGENLADILSLYNAVIAPDSFVLSSETVNEELLSDRIQKRSLLSRQPNQPQIYFAQNFQHVLTLGLRWLVSIETTYKLH